MSAYTLATTKLAASCVSAYVFADAACVAAYVFAEDKVVDTDSSVYIFAAAKFVAAPESA